MLTGGITERREVPHEPGEFFQIRLLSWTQVEEARDARARKGLQHIKDMGQEVYGAIQRATNGAAPADREVEDQYDRMTLLRHGVAAWSYDAPVTPETLSQLDEMTAKWAMGAILGVLFMRSGEERKNADAPFTPI